MVGNGTVFLGKVDGIVALNATTGSQIWIAPLNGEGPRNFGDAVYANNTLYATGNGYIYSLEALTGDIRWQTSLGDEIRSAPLLHNGTLFVGTDDGTLFALGGTPLHYNPG